MAAGEDKNQLLKEASTDEFLKDEQSQVKRENYWVLLKINLYTFLLQ